MKSKNDMSEVSNFYVEFPKLEVEYETHPPVYGASEPGSGGLYLGGPSPLSEQIVIRAVYLPVGEGKKINIIDGLAPADIEALEDEIRSQGGD